jgi:hypothetical protein
LRASVGAPPPVLTVIASLKFTASVTTLQALRSPPPLVMPAPEVALEATIGAAAVEFWILICATDVYHQPPETYSFDIQNEFGLFGSTVADELRPQRCTLDPSPESKKLVLA